MWIYHKLQAYRQSILAAAEMEAFRFQALLWGGIAATIGIMVALALALWLPVSTAGLEEAKRLGIVSQTILNDYPKDHEATLYMASLATALPVAFLTWCVWAWRSGRRIVQETGQVSLSSSVQKAESSRLHTLAWFDYLVLPLLVALFTYDGRFFYEVSNSFTFLAEDGQFADWIQKIQHGKILHQDAYCLYGPLMVYPAAWIMDLFGPSFLSLRIYRFILDIIAYLFVYYLLREITQRRKVALVGMLLFICFYFPWFPSVNGSMLRIVIGLAPLLIWRRWTQTRQLHWLLLSGILAGLIVFYSQEVGIASVLTVSAILILQSVQGDISTPVKTTALFFTGVLIGAAPVLISFAFMGALTALVTNLIEYPRYAMLGYASFPFPSLIDGFHKLMADPSFDTLRSFVAVLFVSYWPVVMYACILLYTSIRVVIGRATTFDFAIFGIACFGLIYYRSALGRSGFDKNGTVFPPGLMLSTILLHWLWGLGRDAYQSASENRGLLGIYAGIGGCIVAGLTSYSLWVTDFSLKITVDRLFNKVIDGPAYFRAGGWAPFQLPQLKGLYGPPEWVAHIDNVVEYIQQHTEPDDYILVFPNEPMYYFLTERQNPTRWGNTYNAVTSAHRDEMVRHLENIQPKYGMYNLNTWRIDNISEEIQVPELTAYLSRYYQPVQEIADTRILKRIPFEPSVRLRGIP